MQVGVVFPQTEIGTDAAAVREWAIAVESWGFAEIEAFDHVLGADASHWEQAPPRGFRHAPYTAADPFYEPFVLFSHLAAVTTRVGFATSVLVLPQRQTALVAKQAATLDVLSGGRLRLGVGVGWNHVEYDALGAEFRGRGRRVEEQIALLRQLFGHPVVRFHGQWDKVAAAGINPLPPQRSIPIWIGGTSDAAIGRVARCGDGWVMGRVVRPDNAHAYLEKLSAAVEAVGRGRSEVGISAWVPLHGHSPEEWEREVDVWRELGADRVALLTRGAGAGPEPHLALLEQFVDAVGVRAG